MFQQRIIKAFPPNYAELKRVFPACSADTIFSYGEVIYRPNGLPISKAVLAHENIHGQRQLDIGLETWWRRYIDDVSFRFEEELVAHRREYAAFCTGIPLPGARARQRMLDLIAARLSGPLYGSLISIARAKDMIR